MATLDTLPPLRDVIAAHDLRAKKSMGQNFLLDLNLTARIARLSGPLEGAQVLEVGPGPGGLTRGLLAEGARRVLAEAGAEHELLEVPGALEIPTVVRFAHRAGRHDGFVALGCVIRGETTHYELVCGESARGLTLLGLDGACIGNGILTVENRAQAEARADPDGMDKGGGAAAAALHLIAAKRRFGGV